jgi:N4-(beta-N-acetylglucosaminyl)-L-asparaginase
MKNRRQFIKTGLALGALPLLPSWLKGQQPIPEKKVYLEGLMISTWNFGVKANTAGAKVLESGGRAVDAAVAGAVEMENDLKEWSIGLGGLPDREGHTTLDACVMDEKGRAGSVCFLEQIKHPVLVAQAVMEKTPHVMLVGEGAQQFALNNGFERDPYYNPDARQEWKKWLVKSEYKPIINIENHDTIGILSIDKQGQLGGACTTSGLAFKMRGRVGDSPIIGSGLYVDPEVGAASATGLGETILRCNSSFLIVELMRNGMSAQEACEEAIRRLYQHNAFMKEEYQACFIAVDIQGNVGAFALRPGFTYSVYRAGQHEVLTSGSLLA